MVAQGSKDANAESEMLFLAGEASPVTAGEVVVILVMGPSAITR